MTDCKKLAGGVIMKSKSPKTLEITCSKSYKLLLDHDAFYGYISEFLGPLGALSPLLFAQLPVAKPRKSSIFRVPPCIYSKRVKFTLTPSQPTRN